MSGTRDAALFVALAAVWGTAFMAINAGLQYFPPILFAALRFDIAAICMLAYAAYVLEDPFPRGRSQWLLVGVGALLLIAAYHVFLFVGQQHTTSAAAAVIVSLSPILTTGFARLFLPEERISVLGFVGLLLGLVGVIVMAQPDPGNLLSTDVVANGLIFAAAASFALGSVLTRRIEAEMPIESMEAWSMVGGALVMHAVSVAHPGESLTEVTLTAEGIGALVYLSVVASGLGFLVYFELLDRLGPIEINLVSYVAPAFAALSGWLWLGEVLALETVIGFGIIVIGFALLKRRELAGVLR